MPDLTVFDRAREIAQIAAVIGDEFSSELLAAVIDRSTQDVEPVIVRLVDADILLAPVLSRQASSSHSGMGSCGMRSMARLLRTRRRDLFASGSPISSSAPSPQWQKVSRKIAARHLSAAGQHQRAAPAWQTASSTAVARGAFREAERANRQALVSLLELPPSRDRDVLHTQLQNALVSILQVTPRVLVAAPTVEAAKQAHDLAVKLDNVEELIGNAQVQYRPRLSSAGKYSPGGKSK